MGKNENWYLLLSHCRYFDRNFTEMFLEWSSTKHTFLGIFDWLPLHSNSKICQKNIKKINSTEAVLVIKPKLCRIVSDISLYIKIIYIGIAQALWLLWELKDSIDLQWEK